MAEDYVIMVFMHYWEENHTIRHQSWSRSYVTDHDVALVKSAISNTNRVRYIQEKFSEKEKEFEEYRQTIPGTAFFNRWDVGLISMFYSIWQADLLRQEYEAAMNKKFDCVFRLRFDSLPKKKFVVEDYDLTRLNVPDTQFDCGGINDRFAFGNSEVMTIYTGVYHEIATLAALTGYQPEAILAEYLRRRQVLIVRPDFPVTTWG